MLDPSKRADTTQGDVHVGRFAAANQAFGRRLRTDAITLATLRQNLRSDPESPAVLATLQSCAHKLAGAAGIFGFQAVSGAAVVLEDGIIERRAGVDTPEIEVNFDALIVCLERALTNRGGHE